ncbi:MAG: hypothetical protein LBD52_03135 [Prevotellaceae bacterium]|nr:hypothetical protein [Prevotellaceae bacterium]
MIKTKEKTIQQLKNARHFSIVYYLMAIICGLCWPAALMAQNGVTVTGLDMNAGTVTFDVSWKNTNIPALWSDSVWVFVEYNNAGKMERLPLITGGATLTAHTAPGVGSVMAVQGNNKGVWVVGNAKSASSGSFSATVKLLVASSTITGICAYASNYRPVGEYISTATIRFKGTPPFNLELNTGSGTASTQAYSDYNILTGQKVLSFTDATGAPGIIKCVPMTGNIDFSVPAEASKGQGLSFVATSHPSLPKAEAVTYTWSAPGFNPASFAGSYNEAYNTIVPGSYGIYPVTLTARSEGYCEQTKTQNVKVLDCLSPAKYDLKVSTETFCAGSSVTFALSNTASGMTYQLYKGNNVVDTFTGTGSAATFTGAFAGAGVYTAQVVANGYCTAAMNGIHTVNEESLPTPPTIAKPADKCFNDGNIVFTASGYSGVVDWVSNGGGVVNNNTVTFARGAATGTKTVVARSAQTYNGTLTCYSGTVTQSAEVNTVPFVSITPSSTITTTDAAVILKANASNCSGCT